MNFSRYVPEGFGTSDFIAVHPEILHIVDLKMGKGVRVNAEWNTQGMLYALGALDEISIMHDCTVRISIVQPRLDHISEWDISVGDLRYWAEAELMPKAQLAWDAQYGKITPMFNPGNPNAGFARRKQPVKR